MFFFGGGGDGSTYPLPTGPLVYRVPWSVRNKRLMVSNIKS